MINMESKTVIKFSTKNVTERNDLIVKLYSKNIKYSYTEKDKEGYYHVTYEE